MSKSYKKKKETVEEIVDTEELSKKEQYDLMKQKKEEAKLKKDKKKKVKKVKGKTHQTNLGARIFAIVMLVLMIGSIITSVAAYFVY